MSRQDVRDAYCAEDRQMWIMSDERRELGATQEALDARERAVSEDTDMDVRADVSRGQHVWPNMNVCLRTKVWFEVNGEFAISEGGLSHERRKTSDGLILTISLTEAKPGKGSHRGTTLTDAGRMLSRN